MTNCCDLYCNSLNKIYCKQPDNSLMSTNGRVFVSIGVIACITTIVLTILCVTSVIHLDPAFQANPVSALIGLNAISFGGFALGSLVFLPCKTWWDSGCPLQVK